MMSMVVSYLMGRGSLASCYERPLRRRVCVLPVRGVLSVAGYVTSYVCLLPVEFSRCPDVFLLWLQL